MQSPIFRDRNPQGTLPFGGGSGRASATRGQASRRPHVTHTWCVRGAPDVPTFPPRHRHQTSPPLSPPGGGGGGGEGPPPYIEGLQGGPGGAKSDFPRQKPAGDSAVWRGVGEGERDSGASFTSSPRHAHVVRAWGPRCPYVPSPPPPPNLPPSLSPWRGRGGGGEGPPPYIEGLQGGPGGAKSDFPRQKPAGDSAVWRGVGEGERDSGASFTSSPRHAHVVRAWGPRCPYVPSPPPPPNLPPSLSPWRGRGGGERDPPPILKDSRGVPGVQSPIFRDRNPQGTLPFGGGSGRASATRGQASRRPHVTHTWCVRGAPDVPTFPPRHRHQTSPLSLPLEGEGGGGEGPPPYIEGLQGGPGGAKSDFPRQKPAGDSAVWRGVGEGERRLGGKLYVIPTSRTRGACVGPPIIPRCSHLALPPETRCAFVLHDCPLTHPPFDSHMLTGVYVPAPV